MEGKGRKEREGYGKGRKMDEMKEENGRGEGERKGGKQTAGGGGGGRRRGGGGGGGREGKREWTMVPFICLPGAHSKAVQDDSL